MAQTPVFVNIATSNMVGKKEDISDLITHLATWDTLLLTKIGMNSLAKTCTRETHQYLEIQERPTRSTLNGAISAGDTTFVITDAVFIASELIQVNEEIVQLGSTSDNLTFTGCSRTKGTGADADHATLAPVTGLGKPRAQGAAAGSVSDLVVYPDPITTYTHIFSKDVVVSDTANVIGRYGRTGTEFDYVANRQLMTLKREFQNAVLWDFAVAPSAVATAGQFDGIYERVIGVNTADLSDLAVTLANARTAARTVRDYGGALDTVACSFYQSDVFDSWGQAHVIHSIDPMDDINMTYGTNVSRLKLGGAILDILPLDIVKAHVFWLTSSEVGIGPLVGENGSRDWFVKPIGAEGDRIKAMVTGEMTCEVRAPRAHYIHTSVKFS